MVLSDLRVKASDGVCPKAIQDALAYLRSTDFSTLPDGEYPIVGRQMFAKVFHLTTKSDTEVRPERHQRYVDVQYWISGRETIGIASDMGQGRVTEEDEAEDIAFYEGVGQQCFFQTGEGAYAVFYPWDFHRPGIWVDGEPEECRKVVVKVSMELLNER